LRQNKLYVTPDSCRAVYEYFRTTLPFRRWKLPDAEAVEFRITKSSDLYGSVYYPSIVGHAIRPRMEVSDHLCWCTDLLLRVIAHEMCHLRQFQLDGWRIVEKGKEYGHGPDFQAMAKLVCRRHGFNLETF
jgi:hypothetical protein